MITIALFRARFPEFDDTFYPDEQVQLFIDDTLFYMGTDELRWCDNYDYAQSYLAAHLLTSGTQTEAGDSNTKAGPISQKVAGGVSVARAVFTKDRSDADDFYMATSYGQRFIVIRNMCFVGVLTARVGD